MFEIEAEEWRNNLNFEIDNDTFYNIVIPCMEFGYNKANEYAKTIIQDLLNNSDEYARQRAIDFLKRREITDEI